MLYCVGHGLIHLSQLKSVMEGTIQVYMNNCVFFSGKYFFLQFGSKSNIEWLYIVSEKYTCTDQFFPQPVRKQNHKKYFAR